PRRAARRHGDQPIAAVVRRAENRVGAAERTERVAQIGWTRVGYVAADDRDTLPREAPECAMHADPEVTGALRELSDAERQPGAIGRDRNDGPEALVRQE